jgi:hypothetical protein
MWTKKVQISKFLSFCNQKCLSINFFFSHLEKSKLDCQLLKFKIYKRNSYSTERHRDREIEGQRNSETEKQRQIEREREKMRK